MPAQIHRTFVEFDDGDDAAARLFGRLHAQFPRAPAAFLDSSDHFVVPAGSRSRYSILAFCLGDGGQSVQLDAGAWQWLAEAWASDRAETGCTAPTMGPNSQFRSGQSQLSRTQPGPPFQLGWLGFVGYEGQGRFFCATHAVVIDHHAGAAETQTLGSDPDWVAAVRAELQQMGKDGRAAAASSSNDAAPTAELTGVVARDARRDYLAKIAVAKQQIREGNSYEVCLTTAVTGEFTGSPWQAYLQMRQRNRAPFTQYLHLPGPLRTTNGDDLVILSTSPERFMQISAEGLARSEPIKGTRPRGADPKADARLREDLLCHPKDRAENVMIADLVRNDLSIHAVPGTLRTERLCAVETYPTVHQLVSTISARLDPTVARTTALAAAFPPGSMTGAPKLSTMQILGELEQQPRGPYSGVAGYFSTTGACDLSVLIRTATLTRPAGGSSAWGFHLGVGGAVTADSVPQAEWEEVLTKSRGVLQALGVDFPRA